MSDGGRRSSVLGSRRPSGGGRGGWVLLALLALLPGCMPGRKSLPRPAPEMLPLVSPLRSHTLADADAWLRHHLMFGEHGHALRILNDSPVAPSDALLRALQEALVLHRSGEHARSNEVLEWAEAEADGRYTRSLTRAAAALALNDRLLAYTPSAAEMAMIPFYRMLNYLALGEMDGALVEARKTNAQLARLERNAPDRCREDAMVLYLAGLVQSAGGERNDALVSLRQAEQAFGACGAGAGMGAPPALGSDLHRAARALGLSELADSVAERYALPADSAGPTGDLLVIVEQGYVSHRSEEALHVPIFPGDIDGLDGEDLDGVLAAAGRISERLVRNLAEREHGAAAVDDHPLVQWGNALGGAYVLRLAWPATRSEPLRPAALRVWVGDEPAEATTVGDLSSVVEREMEAERPAMLARLVARGLTKYLLTREMEARAEKEGGEVAAFLAGRLGNLAANGMERADTRSWSLLPDRIAMVRLRLPEGEHRIRVATAGEGSATDSWDLGTVSVRSGGLALLSGRVWGER